MSFGLPPGFQEQRIINEASAREVERHHAVRRGIANTPEASASAHGSVERPPEGWVATARRALQRALTRLASPRPARWAGVQAASTTFAWDDAHRLTDIDCRLPDGASGVIALVTEDGGQWTAVCVRSPWAPG